MMPNTVCLSIFLDTKCPNIAVEHGSVAKTLTIYRSQLPNNYKPFQRRYFLIHFLEIIKRFPTFSNSVVSKKKHLIINIIDHTYFLMFYLEI